MADLEQGAASKLEKSTTDPTPQKQWKRFKEYAFIKDATFVKKKLIRHLPAWNTIFALVCAVAVSLDTLFIYVPIIDQDNKCLTMDKKLRTIAVVLRLFTDLIYIGDIIFNVVKSSQELKIQWPWEKGKLYTNALAIWNKSCLQILVDFLAILPIPQIIMLGSFKKITGSGHLDRRKLQGLLRTSLQQLFGLGVLLTFFSTFLQVICLEPFGTFSLFKEKQNAGSKPVNDQE